MTNVIFRLQVNMNMILSIYAVRAMLKGPEALAREMSRLNAAVLGGIRDSGTSFIKGE